MYLAYIMFLLDNPTLNDKVPNAWKCNLTYRKKNFIYRQSLLSTNLYHWAEEVQLRGGSLFRWRGELYKLDLSKTPGFNDARLWAGWAVVRNTHSVSLPRAAALRWGLEAGPAATGPVPRKTRNISEFYEVSGPAKGSAH